jgi:hypothetical protein
MSDFRILIRKLSDDFVYCENVESNFCSLILLITDSPMNGSLLDSAGTIFTVIIDISA